MSANTYEVGRIGGRHIVPKTDIGIRDINDLSDYPIPESDRVDDVTPTCAVGRVDLSPFPDAPGLGSGCGRVVESAPSIIV